MSAYGLIDKLAQALNKNVSDEGEQIPPQLNEGISVKDLAFAYEEGKPVLCDVDMELRAGGCYALVGGSGSGKSTILNLLMASSKNYQGEILYDGKELKTISTGSLYDLVSIIQQSVFVFNSTIRDNTTMFSEFPEEEIDRAVRLSGLSKLIGEKGVDYLCGENSSASPAASGSGSPSPVRCCARRLYSLWTRLRQAWTRRPPLRCWTRS